MPSTVHTRAPARNQETPEELALQAQLGSLDAFSELVDRFEERLFNFLARRAGSAADAEDLTQETFLRAWQRIRTYRSEWRFSTWLFTIGARLAVSKGRRAQPRAFLIRDDHAGHTPAAMRGDDVAARTRIWALVDELLGPEQQTALWLRYVEDMAVKDIAGVLGRTQVSVRVMLFRARAVLARRLSSEPALVREIMPAEPLQRQTRRGA